MSADPSPSPIDPADSGDPPDEMLDAIEDEADDPDDDAELIASYAADTERIAAYAELLKTLLAARGFPVVGGDTTLAASHQADLDSSIKRSAKTAILAVLADVRRIANGTSGEGEA